MTRSCLQRYQHHGTKHRVSKGDSDTTHVPRYRMIGAGLGWTLQSRRTIGRSAACGRRRSPKATAPRCAPEAEWNRRRRSACSAGFGAPPGTGRRTVCTRDRRGRDPLAELAAETDRQSAHADASARLHASTPGGAREQLDAQPRGAEGTEASRSGGYAEVRPKPRTLPPHVGLQRRVRRPDLQGYASV